MADALARMMDRIRHDDPEAGVEYDRLRERAQVVAPIVAARHAAGLTQRELAEMTGIAQPVIARLEAGDNNPKLSTLTRISHALGLVLTYTPVGRQVG